MPAVLKEIQAIVDFDLAAMMIREKSRQGSLKVADLMSRDKSRVSRGAYFSYKGTIFAKALKLKKPMLVDKPGALTQKVEKLFFAGRKYRSCLLVPLMTGGVAKGLLVLAAKKPDMFSAEQSLTQWIADGISCVNVHNSLAAEIEKVNQAR